MREETSGSRGRDTHITSDLGTAANGEPQNTGDAIHSTKIPTGPTGKSGPPQKVDQFFRNFPVGPNRSTEFLTEISWNFGWMDRTRGYPVHASSTSHTGHPYNGFGSFDVRSGIGN